jgi:hypothetical protein
MGMDEDGTLLRYGVWHIWLVDGLRWVHQEHVRSFCSGAMEPNSLIQILNV